MVDVGFAPPTIAPDIVEAPDGLGFAGSEPVRTLPLPATLDGAKNVHAHTASPARGPFMPLAAVRYAALIGMAGKV